MRILQLVSAFAYSGPAAPTLALATDLAAQGHDVAVGHDTLRPQGNEHEEGMGPAVAWTGLPVLTDLALSTQSGPLTWLKDRARLRAHMQHADVVHVHFSHDHALAALARPHGKRPVLVRTVHSERSLRARVGQAALLRRADALVLHARAQVEHSANVLGLDRARLHVIRGPVDVQRFSPEARDQRGRAFREAHGIPLHAPLAVMVAIFQAGRGHDHVLRLWPQVRARVPNAALALVGLGELRDAAMKKAAADNVGGLHFVGYLTDTLPDAYAAARVGILRAIGNDGYGRALLEGMACGTPGLVAPLAPLSEVVAASGVGSVAEDDEAFVEALVAALGGPPPDALRTRAYVEQHHTQAAVTRQHLMLYKRLLEEAGTPA